MDTGNDFDNIKLENHKKDIRALKVVYYYLNNVQPNDLSLIISDEQSIGEIIDSINVANGLFSRILSGDKKKWKYLAEYFDYPRNDEIGEITDLLSRLRSSIKKQKAGGITVSKKRLLNTNINYYISHFLMTEKVVFSKAPVSNGDNTDVFEQRKAIPVNYEYGKAPFELSSKKCTNALKTVYYYLNDVYPNDIFPKDISTQKEKILDSCSIVKGLFNRVLRQDRRDWYTVATCFDFPNNDEIIEIADLINKLRQATKNDNTTKIQSTKTLLQKTNINQYIVNFLEHEHAQYDSAKKKEEVDSRENKQQDDAVQKNQTTNSKQQLEKKRSGRRLPQNVTIWIYEAKQPCIDHPNMVTSITAEVLSMRDRHYYPFNVFYCKQCEKYYINRLSYELFAKRYGMPAINKIWYSNSSIETKADFHEWNSESLLHSYGYNVNSIDDIPRFKRQEVLSYVIDHGIMTKDKVVSFLEMLIKRNQYRLNFDAAVNKWRDDLQFVLHYHLEKQSVVKGEFELAKRNGKK